MSSSPEGSKTLRRRSFLKSVAAVGGIAALTPLAAACGSPATPTAAPKPTEAPKVEAKPTEAAKPAATAAPKPTEAPKPTAAPAKPTEAAKPAAQLHKEQILKFNILGETRTVDPTHAEDTNSSVVIQQIFARLVRYKSDLSVEGDIAESWTVAPDGKSYTFKLKDTKWSDGKPVTAKDFEYAFKRMADPKVASPYSHFIYTIKGVEAYNSALGTKEKPLTPSDADLAKLRDAVGVKAVDDKTLKIDLEVPASFFLSLLAHSNMAPVRQDVVDKHGDKWTDADKIVSNGPFLLESWTPKSDIVMKRNPSYFGKAPTLEKIKLTFMSEDATAFAAYQNNELDISHSIPDAQIPQIRQDPKLKAEIVETNELATYYVGLNNKEKPFNDKRVRQAFQMAVDTKTLCEKVLAGVPRPAKSFIPPGMPGHQPEIGFDFNPQKAKELLAQAGYADPKTFPKVTLVYNTSSGHKLRMEYVQAQIKQNLGVDIGVENWEGQTYFRKVATEHPLMYRIGWIGDYPHPNNWLNEVFKTGSGQNYGLYSNKEFDDLNAKALSETDPKKALDLYAQAQKLLVEDAGALWLYYYGRFRLVKPWVKGLVTTPIDSYLGSMHWKDIQILAH